MARKKRLAAPGSRLGLAGSQNSLPWVTKEVNYESFVSVVSFAAVIRVVTQRSFASLERLPVIRKFAWETQISFMSETMN